MIRRTLVALVLTVSFATPAAACDPYWDDCWWWEEPVVAEVWWWEEPVVADVWWWEEPVWEPEPVAADVWWWQEPVWQPAPEPVSIVPEGLYLVTEVYVADVVSVAGPLTTYSTATASETPGTYARVIDTVQTGAASAYDDSAFNGRAALDDGRSVAGTYYENFILSGGMFVPVSVVFFQDDSALAQAPQPTPSPAPPIPPSPAPTASPAPTPAPVVATPAPVVVVPAAAPPAPAVTPTPIARIDPIVEPPPPPPPPPSSGPGPLTAPRVPVIRPGVSSSPLGELRSEIEVLRGRAIPLWIRAAVDGVPQPVASWRIRSGDHVALGPSGGDGDDAFSARWDVVTPPGIAWILGIETTTVVGGVPHLSVGEILIVVRSPALVR